MKKLDWYILKNFIKMFITGSMAFIVIFISMELFRIVGYIMDGRISYFQGGLLLLNMMPEILLNIIPLGVLLGSLMTVNKMASNLEITALKTSGISFLRIALYPLICALAISMSIMWLNNNVIPKANKRVREIKHQEVYNVAASKTKTDVYIKGQGSYITYVRLIDSESNILYNAEIVVLDDNFVGVEKIVAAKKGSYDRELKKWTFYDVDVTDLTNKSSKYYFMYEPLFLLETPDDFLRDKVRANEMNPKMLKDNIKFIKETGGEVRELTINFYKKTAYPFSAFIMAFIGLALGSRYVRGGASAINIGLSVVIGYLYYVVMVTLEAVALGGYVSPLTAVWIPNVLFAFMGIYAMKLAEY